MKLYKHKNAFLSAITIITSGEQALQVKILSQKYNPLLKRKEIAFEIDHSQEGQTTSRSELRNSLASLLKTKVDLIHVKKIKTKTGTMIAVGEANAYDTVEQAKTVERDHIIARDTPPKKKIEEEKHAEGEKTATPPEEGKKKEQGE
jgi:small subunit ribosomal protein S24e